jgi:uncharacterized protein YndB with AHSA1/START domain
MSTTKIRRHMNAPRAAIYRALLDPGAVRHWMVPDNMTSHVHFFEPREGGAFRISLGYDDETSAGKSGEHTDTYHGEFVRLVPDAEVVQTMEFETTDPELRGKMRVTFRLADAEGGGTDLDAVHDDVPPGVPPADNQTGWRMSLDKLARLVEPKPHG